MRVVDRAEAIAALRRVDRKWKRMEAVRAERIDAIVAAFEAGLTINEIADLLDVGHEIVRRTIRAADR